MNRLIAENINTHDYFDVDINPQDSNAMLPVDVLTEIDIKDNICPNCQYKPLKQDKGVKICPRCNSIYKMFNGNGYIMNKKELNMKRLIKKADDTHYPTLKELCDYVVKYCDEVSCTERYNKMLYDFAEGKIEEFDDVEKMENYDEYELYEDFMEYNLKDDPWTICEVALDSIENNAPSDVCEVIDKCREDDFPNETLKDFANEIIAMYDVKIGRKLDQLKEENYDRFESDGIEEEYWQDAYNGIRGQ